MNRRWYLDDETPSWDFFWRRLVQAIVVKIRQWKSRASVLLLCYLAGCTPQLVLQMAPVSPERVTWEHAVTDMANDHEARLKALEATTITPRRDTP